MRSSIIIAAHNEGERLLKTIESCVETGAGLDYEIVVADDASTDDAPEAAARRFAPVRLHRQSPRRGASSTKHLGAQMARGDVFIFLDAHSKPEYGSLQQLVRDVEETEGQAIVTPRVAVLDVERWQNVLTQVGHGYAFDLLTLETRWVPLEELQKSPLGRGNLFESPALIGCAFAISRTLYEKLWGFDAHMSSWGVEDLDLALKCWLMGHPILHDPEIVIGHRFQETFTYSVPEEHVVVNQLRLSYKNYTQEVWREWLLAGRQRYVQVLPEHPEGLWARAWELFKAGEDSARQERSYLHAHRIRDEFWYARRFRLEWPQLTTRREVERPLIFALSPSPSPRPTTITSQTVATIPPNRARTTIGVGEQVLLTFSRTNAAWSLTGGGQISSSTGKTIRYTAGATAGAATITAADSSGMATIQFNVIAPSGVIDRRAPGTPIKHTHNRPDSGFQTEIFLTPDVVSFQFLNFKELDVPAVATGVYAPFNGVGHHPNPTPLPVGPVVPGLGSKAMAIDTIYSGDPGTPPPFAPGAITFQIPYQYQLQSGGPLFNFATVTQQSSLASDGHTLSSSKAGASISVQVSDPTTG